MLRLPFTIRAPLTLPAPSLSAPEFTLRWLLRAVLDRPRRPDPTTTLELWAATAPWARGCAILQAARSPRGCGRCGQTIAQTTVALTVTVRAICTRCSGGRI